MIAFNVELFESLGTQLSVKGLTLALRKDVCSLCVLYRIYHGECTEKMFDLILTAELSNRTVRHKFILDMWHSTTMRFHKNSLPRTTELSNGLFAAAFPGRYDMSTLKKRVYHHFKGWQCTCSSSGVAVMQWAAVVTYHRVTRTLVCLVFSIKNNRFVD